MLWYILLNFQAAATNIFVNKVISFLFFTVQSPQITTNQNTFLSSEDRLDCVMNAEASTFFRNIHINKLKHDVARGQYFIRLCCGWNSAPLSCLDLLLHCLLSEAKQSVRAASQRRDCAQREEREGWTLRQKNKKKTHPPRCYAWAN